MLPRSAGGEGIFPEALAMLRMLGGAAFFQVLGLISSRKSAENSILAGEPGGPEKISRKDLLTLAGLSVLGIALNQTLFLIGLKFTTPFSVALLSATIPVFAAALAVLFRKERASARTALGLGLSVSGVLFLVGVGTLDKGAILVSLNSLSYAAYVVLSRDVVMRVGARRAVTWIFTFAAILFLPVGIGPLLRQLPELTTRGWMFALYILAMPTIVAYLLNAWALGRSSATVVTVYIYAQPLIAALLAWLQLGQRVSSRAAIAAVPILLGLGIVATRRSLVEAERA